jgi:hypothetical protein
MLLEMYALKMYPGMTGKAMAETTMLATNGKFCPALL